MRKFFLSVFILILIAATARAQHKLTDSLRRAVSKATSDTARMILYRKLSTAYFVSNPDSSIMFDQLGYDLAVKYNNLTEQARNLNNFGNAYGTIGDYVKSLQFYFKGLKVYNSMENVSGAVTIYDNIGATYVQSADYEKALDYLRIAQKQWDEYKPTHQLKTSLEFRQEDIINVNIAECFLYTGKIDSADHYLELCYPSARKRADTALLDNVERDFGEVELARGHKDAALRHLRNAASLAKAIEDVEMQSVTYLSTAKLYRKYRQRDSAIFYAKKALETAQSQKYAQDVLNAGKVLYGYYEESNNIPEAYKYYKLATEAKDSLYSESKVKQILSLDFEEKQRQQELEAARTEAENRVRMYVLSGVIGVFLLLAVIFWIANKQRKKANELLQKQKEEIETALSQLKITQAQLVQSEKMASLGELTAGIAHEIQNPLNFVNNFSEVNAELLDEMQQEIDRGNFDEVKSIAADIIENSQKIVMHGKRADGIVKGMLQHSRASSNVKEPTDINKLADEYLRLAFHGLRAKDKSFNAELVTHFAEGLPEVDIVPQDMGRVILNLFNNAFYAVQKRKQMEGDNYQPVVEVTTAKNGKAIEITVKDNGTGIPEDIKDKILQPFFTTKPTGEGTGLGLSLSYDILVKGHNGKIDVKSKEGEYTEFRISIPV